MNQHVEVVDLITPSPEPEPKLVPWSKPTEDVQHFRASRPTKTSPNVDYERPVYQSIERNGVSSPARTISPKKGSLAGLIQLIDSDEECEGGSHNGRKRRLSTPSEIAYRPCPKPHKRYKHSGHASNEGREPSPTSPPPLTYTPPVESNQLRGKYSDEENALLYRLKAIENRSWDEVQRFFPNRSRGSLQVHFSTKLKNYLYDYDAPKPQLPQRPTEKIAVQPHRLKKPIGRPSRDGKRDGGPSAVDGFVSWKDVDLEVVEVASHGCTAGKKVEPTFPYDYIEPKSLARHLRQRELGGVRSGSTKVPEEMVNHTFVRYRLRKSFSPTCGDVNSLAWSPDLRSKGIPLRFAAASIAISDNRNMQYNGGLNLLAGDYETQTLQELPDHHVERPVINRDLSNANSLPEMRNTQDSRLYKTVNDVAFSSCGTRLFSVGDDSTLRSYRFRSREAVLEHSVQHAAPVTLMSVNTDDMVATACKMSVSTSIQVHQFQDGSVTKLRELAVDGAKFLPAALRWGVTSWRKQYLLAGFSGEGYERDSLSAGATYLWDTNSGTSLGKIGHTPNVLQIAWNPVPSSATPWFCVASAPPKTFSKSTRSVVQCFGPSKTSGIRELFTFESPAKDLNELTYCQHDPMLIAAGGTDGRVYIWDARFVRKTQHSMHILEHGNTVQVLDHDRDPEEANTGIGFLSWGATSSRLYSGSSDGVVKVWNPRRAVENAYVGDVACFPTAIMSGSFSPDYRDLLIGEECGRLNLLSVDNHHRSEEARVPFKLQRAAPTQEPQGNDDAAELLAAEKIVIRPMGNLPIRQAVQGRNYQGPFFKPSMKAWDEAQTIYDKAKSRIELATDSDLKIEEAKKQLQAAEHLLTDYRAREADWQQLETDAIAKQRQWAQQEPVTPQPRPANIENIPRDMVITAEMKSQQRIPENLRHLARKRLDVRRLTCRQLYDLSLAPRCTHCEKAANAGSKRLKAHYRGLCKAQRVRTVGKLTCSCNVCGAPMGGSGVEWGVCVRCEFQCIRCGEVAEVSASSRHVVCGTCELVWEVGVLGYDLEGGGKVVKGRKPGQMETTVQEDERYTGEEVIDAHLDHLWTHWDT